ncbi:phosphoadenylyl-sulfate reductase [Xanthobacter sp. TB0136]|uniref:phosphoadenylyl-sulfate reductase n=1 Tax=Xanthobacter sp. TB0136 TaxID=3459177 RepID=UPI00403A3443
MTATISLIRDIPAPPAPQSIARTAGTPPPLDIAALDARLREAEPADIIAAGLEAFPDRITAVSSFGTESVVLLHVLAQVDPNVPVLFLDTGHLFPETLAYRDELAALLGLTAVRTFHPDAAALAARDPETDLWSTNPDACCDVRKVEPLAEALRPFEAWINGRKRYQSETRASIPVVERDGLRVKFNPLASMGREEITAYMDRYNLPHHPLEKHGFASIGCMPCTSRVKPGEDPRAGRWRGRAKTECGIHCGDGI